MMLTSKRLSAKFIWVIKMPLVKEVNHIFEPNPLACGQAVIAMLSGVNVFDIIDMAGTERETTLNDMKSLLKKLQINIAANRVQVIKKEQLPQIAVLSLETPKCWHWSLYFDGKFYDPEYGILDDFPPSYRRYYWEIKNDA